MNVSLTLALEAFVAEKVQSGRYTSAGEVVREALRLLEEHEQIRAIQLAEFQTELDRRLDALDRGEHADPLRVRAELRSRSQRRRVSRR